MAERRLVLPIAFGLDSGVSMTMELVIKAHAATLPFNQVIGPAIAQLKQFHYRMHSAWAKDQRLAQPQRQVGEDGYA